MTPPRCLEVLAATRARLGGDVPLIPMTYAAIVERYGDRALLRRRGAAPARPG